MKTSYNTEDVILLLKDITNMVMPISTEEREKKIQEGTHYSEMLPVEYKPTKKYMEMYDIALKNYSKQTAEAVCLTAEKIYKIKGENVVLVSLARAGIPVGILIKHYLNRKYGMKNLKHYSISIIRGKEIDHNAMKYILERHKAEDIQFVDGWIGKGAILTELKKSLENYKGVSTELAVLSDPANITELCGTHEDILIPSSCLNSTVSGLISRTFLRKDIITENDFHGAVYYSDLIKEDVSYEFIKEVEKYFDFNIKNINNATDKNGIEEVLNIGKKFGIKEINFIKPGIGEATRVLLRRVPWKLLISEKYKNDPVLQHLYRLAQEKNVPIEYYPLNNYKACGIIKNLSDL
ncbi:cysteine protease StiP family protein [Fusobacterium varium]|uniref:cysteine protease StiP family protein n=1 Tax=Fusobacterium varium TaxID=856 RepID=UPI0027DC5091|nr:cysteine protease StiP family protein [uncultured Fusobacterium sp.]